MTSDLAKIKALNYYAKKFQRLRVDRAHGVAPHKPILLLSVTDLINRFVISENKIYLSQDLISRPFFHMRSGKFWHLWANPGYEKVITSKVKLKTFAEVKASIEFAYLDEDLFDFLKESKSRQSLTRILVNKWFPGQMDTVERLLEDQRYDERLG